MSKRAQPIKCVLAVLSLWFGLSASCDIAVAAGTTIMKPLTDPDRSLWTMPDYTVTTPGKWTIVVHNHKSIRFQSVDRTKSMQAGVVELHPKAKQTEDEAFRQYVDDRRQLEHDNIDNPALKSEQAAYVSDQRGTMVSWSITDSKGASGHLTAILHGKRRLLVVSYDVDKVSETDFRKDVEIVLGSMALN